VLLAMARSTFEILAFFVRFWSFVV
jgi:hypothetical protein